MNGRASRPTAGVLVGLLLLAGGTACTGRPEDGSASRSTDASPSAKPRPSVPLRVSVTHVAGRLSPQKRTAVAAGVRRALASYTRGAFLAGDYPRTDFRDAFGSFTATTAAAARHDQALLTNRPLGSSTSSVRAVRRTAYVSVLAPKQKVSGATAAVNLVFVVDRGDATARRVHLKGRMLLTRDKHGRWAVFGYDLNRSQTATGSGS